MAEEKKDKPRNVYSKEVFNTPPGRLSYPFLYTRRTEGLKEGAFTTTLIVPKDKDDKWKPLFAEGLKVAREHFGPNIKFSNLKNPVKDGDKRYAEVLQEKGEEEAKKLSYLKGCRYIDVSMKPKEGSERRPGLTVLMEGKVVPMPADHPKIKGGDYAILSVQVMSYELVQNVRIIENGKTTERKEKFPGFTFGLRNVLFLKAGEALGGGSDPSNDFKKIDVGELDEYSQGEPMQEDLFGEGGGGNSAQTSSGPSEEEMNF